MATGVIEPLKELTTKHLPHRILGKTGESVPMLGLGTGPGGIGMADSKATALYNRAIDLGVTYIDTAPSYGNAHHQLSEIMRYRRNEVFLATKTQVDTKEEALKILETSLRDLQTDHADLVYVHHMGERNVEKLLGPEGALEGLREAQIRGWTRFIGITAHNQPWKVEEILKKAQIDVIMVALNPGDLHTYNFQGKVLDLAHEQNVAVAAMKVYGGADEMEYRLSKGEDGRISAMEAAGNSEYELALRYALGLTGITTAVIGMYRETELLQNIEWVRRYQPLSKVERDHLISAGRILSDKWSTHFGPVK